MKGFTWRGLHNSHNSASPLSKERRKQMVCGSVESSDDVVGMYRRSEVMPLRGHTHACEPWARERAGCSQHWWAVCPRKKLHQPFPADPASYLPNRAAWLGAGETLLPDMLLVPANREEAVQGQAGESLDLTLAGED